MDKPVQKTRSSAVEIKPRRLRSLETEDQAQLVTLIETAKSLDLHDVAKVAESHLKDENANDLTEDEVTALNQAFDLGNLNYHGFHAEPKGITVFGGESVSDIGLDLQKIFDAFKETLVFDGFIEVTALDIENYVRYEFKDSKIKSFRAEINWVLISS